VAEAEEPLTEGEETYRLLAKGESFRIGLATRTGEADPPSTSIEFLVRLFRTGKRLGLDDVNRALELVNGLADMGYTVFFQEDGWISCERPVGEADAGAETQRLRTLLGSR